MADVAPASTTVPSPAGTPNPADPPAAPVVPDEPKFVSLEEHRKVLSRLEGISGVLNELKAKVKPPEPPKPRELPEVAKQVEELTARVTKAEAERQELEAEQLSHSLTTAFQESGVSPAMAEVLAENWRSQRKFKKVGKVFMQVEKTDAGESEVAVADVVKVFLATDKGREFVTQKRPPISDMSKGVTPAGKRTVAKSDLASGNYSLEDMIAGKLDVK